MGDISTRFLIISDTHDLDIAQYTTTIVGSSGQNGYGFRPLPAVDVVLHCGDLTEGGGRESHQKALRGLASIRAELKLMIPGNHDMDLDARYLSRNLDSSEEAMKIFEATRAIWTGDYARKYGEGAFQYPSRLDRFNGALETPLWAENNACQSSLIRDNIDVLMTHGPPKYILDRAANGSSAGCEHLRRAVCRAKPRMHCFGHVHCGWGVRVGEWRGCGRVNEDAEEGPMWMPEPFIGKNESKRRGYAKVPEDSMKALNRDDGTHTLFVNAAVSNEDGKMQNVPWVFDLNLRRQEPDIDSQANEI